MRTTYEFSDEEESQRQVFERSRDFFAALWDIYDVVRRHQKYEVLSASQAVEEIGDIVCGSGILGIE